MSFSVSIGTQCAMTLNCLVSKHHAEQQTTKIYMKTKTKTEPE